MVNAPFPKRILLTGYEVGSLARIIREKYPDMFIGAIDVLGNIETRLYADWKFSILKQSPETSFIPPKHKTIPKLLYELTKIMLEELEFDLLIPLSPFNKKPDYIARLSHEINVNVSNLQILKKTFSEYRFLLEINQFLPQNNIYNYNLIKFSEIPPSNLPVLFIMKEDILFLSTNSILEQRDLKYEKGFIIPFSKLFCAFFLIKQDIINFLGIQTLQSPSGHNFFYNCLEKNAFLPSSFKDKKLYEMCKSSLLSIIRDLDLTGFITIYFGVNNANNNNVNIQPVSCCAIPDDNLFLWELRASNSFISYLLNPDFEIISKIKPFKYAFKIPLYSAHPIRVPDIPKDIADRRNIPGVISNPEYSICTIWGSSTSLSRLNMAIDQKKTLVEEIIFPNY